MFKSAWKKITSSLGKFRSQLGSKIKALFSKGVQESSFEDLEKLLFEADLGSSLSMELVDKVKEFYQKSPHASQGEVLDLIQEELLNLFAPSLSQTQIASPQVILLVGINGTGKTTSLAKLARLHQKEGKKVLLAACDTFRAAAIDQLKKWAARLDLPIVLAKMHSDPSAVVFDALTSALAQNYDVVLADTAGRLHTKTDLMKELEKIRKVCQKKIPEAPHETLLVVDATTGQNALDQARIFHAFTPLTGIILTKLDGTAKGGIAAALKRELDLPIKWIGTGEKEEDLSPFDPKSFVEALLQ